MRAAACLLLLLPFTAFGQMNPPPHALYMSIVRSKHILAICEQATPARQEWLDHIMVKAKKRIEFLTDAERAQLDADMVAGLAREFPRKPTKEYCAEFIRNLDLERKTLIRD